MNNKHKCRRSGAMENRHQDEAGFTLTELITAVAVIAMLAVVLVPALAAGRSDSARAVCLNNLRQLGTAELMYASEYSDYIPFPNWGISTSPGWLYANTNNSIPDPTSLAFSNNPAAAYRGGLWFEYVRNPKTYLCPTDVESRWFPQRPNKLCSYVMNGAVCGYTGSYRSCRITDAWTPACFLLYTPDENASNGGHGMAFNDGASFPTSSEGFGRLHTPNGADILTASGSVQFFSSQQIVHEQNASGKSLAFWTPFVTGGP
jgi:prepilin-type N-terminal cleavage/methylation domain-containing protein